MHHPYEQLTEQWFAVRVGKVTASIAGACLGHDPRRGPYWAYQEILGNHKTVERYGGGEKPQNWGREKEQGAVEAFEAQTGLQAETCGFHTHDAHPWLGASPDRLIVGSETAGLEIKCPLKGLPKRVPIHDRMQCLIGMACTGRRIWFAFYWTPEDSRLFVVRPAGTEGLIARLKRWFDAHITPQIPPPRRVPGRAKRRKKEFAVEDHPMAHAYPFDPDNMDTTGYEEPS